MRSESRRSIKCWRKEDRFGTRIEKNLVGIESVLLKAVPGRRRTVDCIRVVSGPVHFALANSSVPDSPCLVLEAVELIFDCRVDQIAFVVQKKCDACGVLGINREVVSLLRSNPGGT